MTMWNLKALQGADYRAHLDIAFNDGSVTDAEKDALIALYAQYEEAKGRPLPELKGPGHRAELYELLYHAYELVQDGRRLKELRAQVKLRAAYCPYCGFAPISQLDHFLQRTPFKLLSIFGLNLIPCCSPCNNGKRQHPSNAPTEHQLHPYLEDVSGFSFLRATASLQPQTGGLAVKFWVEQPQGMLDELHQRLVTHLTEFGLQAKYEKQLNIFLGELEYSISSSFAAGGAEGLKATLNGTANATEKRFGTNDWRTALLRGLHDCPPFWQGGFRKALGF